MSAARQALGGAAVHWTGPKVDRRILLQAPPHELSLDRYGSQVLFGLLSRLRKGFTSPVLATSYGLRGSDGGHHDETMIPTFPMAGTHSGSFRLTRVGLDATSASWAQGIRESVFNFAG